MSKALAWPDLGTWGRTMQWMWQTESISCPHWKLLYHSFCSLPSLCKSNQTVLLSPHSLPITDDFPLHRKARSPSCVHECVMWECFMSWPTDVIPDLFSYTSTISKYIVSYVDSLFHICQLWLCPTRNSTMLGRISNSLIPASVPKCISSCKCALEDHVCSQST